MWCYLQSFPTCICILFCSCMMAETLTEVITFLRQRGVSEEVIELMEKQKIDRDVIILMEDAELADYLPSYGDRIALFNFCRRKTTSSKRKLGLFEKLREKLKVRKEKDQGEEEPQSSNKVHRAKKSKRMVEIGWVHTDSNITKQIRAKQGGGTRKVPMNVQSGFSDILKEGKALFFPDGKSSKGHESNFDFDVWDFKQNPFPKDNSVEMIYNTVKLPILRFYIATQPKAVLNEESVKNCDQASALLESDQLTHSDRLRSTPERDVQDQRGGSEDSFPEVFFVSEQIEATQSSVNTHLHASTDHVANTFVDDIRDPITLSVELEYSVEETVSHAIRADVYDPEISFGAQQIVDNDSLSDTLPYQPEELPHSSPQALSPRILVLHYSNSFAEMIEAFSDPEIMNASLTVKRLLPDSSLEAGAGSGVLRDVYSCFWTEFYERCTLGTTLKVPFLRHDFTAEKWKAVGRILLKGFQDCKYIPVKLALPFLEEVFFGTVCSDLRAHFLQFVSCQDRDILCRALDDFTSVDLDDLLEILNTFECRRHVTAATLAEILNEISHKELVQKPMFVIDCWREVTQLQTTLSCEELTKMYSDLKPTPKKVAKMLMFPTEMTSKQAEVATHLRRYVRELDEDKLGRFLRFCTGSDLVVSSTIGVDFIHQSDFTRRPIGRTCGMLIHLSESYDHFPDFRAEFNAVLESNIWVMDIV
ncbi:hypothetical protein AMEX_G4595 [Astyanax mexicanus]|uniref:Uncharacterized protein n=1 Tax=Astyanax mexicanus TaxID=7994 RepID=A0A8T2M9L2_ASTMX|nr:hypothetical protein AMEX_G11902 [Astyanax mexicanus]KAG9278465.1 hypothetical protein AMEX_G6341 [Astyanax mexicanus]KAG9279123.1 hypothetical protein AMEX_G4595 [Astyanax mexicanus]